MIDVDLVNSVERGYEERQWGGASGSAVEWRWWNAR